MKTPEEIQKKMKELATRFSGSAAPLEMPPQSSLTLGTQFLELDFGKMLTVEIKYDFRFSNPMRVFQGGFLGAAFDEAFGPLSYMAAGRPVATIEMSTTFMRPFTAKDESIHIRAEVVVKTKVLLVMKAEAKSSKSGKLIATASNHSLILSDANLSKLND